MSLLGELKMKEIHVDLSLNQPIIEQINKVINGESNATYNEHILTFDNEIGKGAIRNIIFDWGISLLDYDVYFNEKIKLVFEIAQSNPIEFLFVSEGNLLYSSEHTGKNQNLVKLQRYQNTILSNLPNSNNTFIFPSGEDIKLNVIKIIGDQYSNKSNNYIDTLQKSLKSILSGKSEFLPYKHLGNFNLKLADIIETLNAEDNSGIVRSLNIEGQLNLILALQILEHKSYETKLSLPNSISKTDLNKTKTVSKYICENLHDSFTVKDLADMHAFSPKKMQIGFKLLYGKSVNEYIRTKKLELARELIESTQFSISEIVYQISYKSRSYFSKIFYDNYNILPADYKELVRSKSSISEEE
ncbi:MAG: AraC family transcriptional regulator [Flavobacteriaceae bacterium]|nr:AraC family transcriptional regulator [Flavobacteriaceae bacterium]|tara:strand:- start:1788 stop:2861 length:1074 start_codon:yes stop_codon:yes gene_type:complete